jgi:hypothetical protein
VYDEDDEEEGRFRKRRRPPADARRGFLFRFGSWLVGAVILGIAPLAAALWALSLAKDYVPALKQATTAAAAGGGAVVTIAFSVALFIELYVYWKIGPGAGSDADAPITGRRQFLIVYVLVPLLPGLVVAYLTLSPATRLSQAIDWIRQPAAIQVERQVGQAVRDSAAGETRVAGLRALAQFGSRDALDELARLATGDPQLLNDPASFDALTSALASFGNQAEPVLQRIWKEAGSPAADRKAADGRTPADVVLAAYNRIDAIADTASAYALAREAAAAPASSPERQAAAIALIAKCGSRSDVALLASFLVNRPESVKQAALDGLRQLDARLRKQETPPVTNAPAPAGR